MRKNCHLLLYATTMTSSQLLGPAACTPHAPLSVAALIKQPSPASCHCKCRHLPGHDSMSTAGLPSCCR